MRWQQKGYWGDTMLLLCSVMCIVELIPVVNGVVVVVDKNVKG
jgi:hypothetical protein